MHLHADDMMTREKMVAYHDSYAKAMERYGLRHGVRGSEVRHTTTAQYYHDLKRQTGELEANMRQLQTEQRQAERQLDKVKKDINSEKFEAVNTEAKAAFVTKVNSLLGRNRLKAERKKLQRCISPPCYFPYVEKLLPLIGFCRNTLNFSEKEIRGLCKLKQVRLKDDFYSLKFNSEFRNENAAFSFEEDKNRKEHYLICVNNIPLVQWFRQKAHERRYGLEITSTKQGKALKI